jgi:hypothetical protein
MLENFKRENREVLSTPDTQSYGRLEKGEIQKANMHVEGKSDRRAVPTKCSIKVGIDWQRACRRDDRPGQTRRRGPRPRHRAALRGSGAVAHRNRIVERGHPRIPDPDEENRPGELPASRTA